MLDAAAGEGFLLLYERTKKSMAKKKETKKTTFELVAEVIRTCVEQVEMVIEADDEEEAYEIADEVILTYPRVQPRIKRFLIRERDYREPEMVILKNPEDYYEEPDVA